LKFICLGYADLSQFAKMPEDELKRMMDECWDYDDVLRAGGQFAGGEALQEPTKAITLRYVDGKVQATDGPFAETKEQLGGILVLEADNMEHAVELMSKHPGVRSGPFEIRPADAGINALITARDIAIKSKQKSKTAPHVEVMLDVFGKHLAWLEETVADIPDSRFAEQPHGVRNHPAWTVSHLNSSIGFLLKLLKENDGASTDEEDKKYGNGSIPTTDRSQYLSKVELLRTLRQRHELVDAAVRSKHEEYFARETPESLREFAPTIGRIAVYLLAAHESYHLGQLMQWRRAAGMIPQ
jgi:hypothetical protein